MFVLVLVLVPDAYSVWPQPFFGANRGSRRAYRPGALVRTSAALSRRLAQATAALTESLCQPACKQDPRPVDARRIPTGSRKVIVWKVARAPSGGLGRADSGVVRSR